jgi:Flp pilus assembly protein CpaB
VITSADFHWTAWPTGLIPPGTQDLVVEGTLVRSRVAPGEPILASSLLGPASSASAALGPAERAVAIPLPLAPPPVRPGDLVDLVGIRAAFGTDDDRQLLQSVRLGRGRVVSVDDRSITVAVDETRAVAIVEHVAAGSVEIVMTPFEE